MEDLSHLRQSYTQSQLSDQGLPDDPVTLFGNWFSELKANGKEIEVNCMTVSTLGQDGFPKSRVVLLKSYDTDGFVFFTNYESEKGRAIAAHPKVCLSFFWPSMERQVIIKGTAGKLDQTASETYFQSRPRGSQLGALASNQSRPVASRAMLDDHLAELERQYEGATIPKPEYWGGYLIRPESVEFWQGRANRMHDRILYSAVGNGWRRERLQP